MPGSLFDTNVWLALAFTAHPFHAAANAAFLARTPRQPVMFCRATQQSFLRLLTTEAIIKPYGVPTPTNHDALTILDRWTASPSVGYAEEPANLLPRWRTFADLQTSSPKRWMDAYLAAFAMAAGLALITFDGAFSTFAGLNPTVLTAASVLPPPAAP